MGNGYITTSLVSNYYRVLEWFYNLLTAYEHELGGLYMKDNVFRLAGKVNVPAEKKNEMNRHVLEILDKCGIRKTVEIHQI